MGTATPDDRDREELAALNRSVILIVIVWTVLVLSAFAWNARQKCVEISELAHTQWIMGATYGMIWMLVLLGVVLMSRRVAYRIQERHKDQRELLESRSLFQTVADFSSDWIFWRNPDGSLRYVSPACEQITGYTPEEFYANPGLFNDIIRPEDRERWARHVHKADENGHPSPLEFRIVTKRGETRYIRHSCRAIFDESKNRFLGVRGSNHDITAFNEHQQILIHQSRLAAMGEMMGNIAHQWRQPLNALGLVLANLKDAHEFDELDKEYLDKSVENGEKLILKMSCTIDDFRNFFKPNKAKQQFDLCKAVEDILGLVRDSFKADQVDIGFKCEETVQVNGFPNEFSQVLLNVLSNARDVIVERKLSGGKIEISMGKDERNERNVWVAVTDNAGGIPPDVLPRIFDPYFTTKEKGSGIGLYMSNMIMEHMDGKIEARNAGAGAEFTIVLPKWEQPLEAKTCL